MDNADWPIFDERGRQVTRDGVLGEAQNLFGNLNEALYKTFLGLGNYATEYMKGKVPDGDWFGRIRDSRYVAKDDPGTSLLLEFLFKESETIRSRKGYRFNELTPREHKLCGSSGYGAFAGPNGEYLDMPVSLANAILKLSADMETPTIEEVRRARELEGQPTIDERGFVTGTIFKRNSYDFLPPGEVDRVKAREMGISSAMDLVSLHTIDIQITQLANFMPSLLRYLSDAGEDKGRLSTPDLTAAEPHMRDILSGERVNFSEITEGAKAVAFGLGYRDGILTPQEILIAAGRRADLGAFDPHVPLGIQTKELGRGLTARRRGEEQRFTVYTNVFTGNFDYYHTISLEPLADNGSTLRGPQIINPDTGQPWNEMTVFYKDKCKVPHAREGDWFFKT
jgi:hypothetical protein